MFLKVNTNRGGNLCGEITGVSICENLKLLLEQDIEPQRKRLLASPVRLFFFFLLCVSLSPHIGSYRGCRHEMEPQNKETQRHYTLMNVR